MEIIISLLAGVILLAIFFLLMKNTVRRKLKMAEAMVERGSFEPAIGLLQSVIRNEAGNFTAHRCLAEAYSNSGREQLSVVEFNQALACAGPKDAAAVRGIHDSLSRVYIKLGRPDEALDELLFLLKDDPGNSLYLNQVGKIYHDRGMNGQALAFLERAVRAGVKDASAHFLTGRILFDTGMYPEAEAAFNSGLALEPENPEIHHYLGMIIQKSESCLTAMKEFDQAEKTGDSGLRMQTIYQKGMCKLENGDSDGAREDLERALRDQGDPQLTAAVHYSLGTIYEKDRKILEAVRQWQKAAALAPDYKDVRELLKKYETLAEDDRIKDLLTVNSVKFEVLCTNLLKSIGYEVIESQKEGNDTLEMAGIEVIQGWTKQKGSRVLVKFTRRHQDVDEVELVRMIDKLKARHVSRLLYFTVGDFTDRARRYSENRPIDLYDRERLMKILKERESWL